eukprot:13031903-Ditylum_brightwellii.AAC.1
MFKRLEISTHHCALPTRWDELEINLYEFIFWELGIFLKIVLLGPCSKLMVYKVVTHELAHNGT